MKDPSTDALFPMGLLMMTPGAQTEVPRDEMEAALLRHAKGDWGDVCDEDRDSNNEALVQGARLMSVYHTDQTRLSSRGRVKFWIITEADRSVTTVLLPEEY